MDRDGTGERDDVTHRRKERSKVILSKKDFRVDEKEVLCCPIPNDCNMAQLVRHSGQSHGLVARDNTTRSLDRKLGMARLTH